MCEGGGDGDRVKRSLGGTGARVDGIPSGQVIARQPASIVKNLQYAELLQQGTGFTVVRKGVVIGSLDFGPIGIGPIDGCVRSVKPTRRVDGYCRGILDCFAHDQTWQLPEGSLSHAVVPVEQHSFAATP